MAAPKFLAKENYNLHESILVLGKYIEPKNGKNLRPYNYTNPRNNSLSSPGFLVLIN